jgi:putative transferase (TIGR04331 family)
MPVIWNSIEVERGLDATCSYRSQLLAHLKALLDNYHGIDLPLRYYDLLAGDWLEQFLHVVYAAWREDLAAREQSPEFNIPVASDTRGFSLLVMEDANFHRYLRNAVAHLITGGSPSTWEFSQERTIVESRQCGNYSKRIVGTLATVRPKLLICDPYFKCSKGQWLTAMLQWRRWAKWDDLEYPVSVTCKVDSDWRRARASDRSVGDLGGLLHALMPLHLPVALVEAFADFRRAALCLRLNRPGALYTANALHSHLLFKLLAAEWHNAGTLVLGHQHGGSYGLDKIHVVENYEARVSDRFYTWGWRGTDPWVYPLSAPALVTKLGRRRRQVLLNCVMLPRYVYRLHFHPLPGTIEILVRETASFASMIAGERSLLVRLYQSDWGWGMAQAICSAAPGVEFDEARPNVFGRYAESELVVHNYLGTSWLETLAMNVPTVCFFDPDTYAFRADAQPYLDALEKVGILHRSGSGAAKFSLSLGQDIAGWWRKAEVQIARQNFIGRYAKFSQDWKLQWEAEFEGLADSGMRH